MGSSCLGEECFVQPAPEMMRINETIEQLFKQNYTNGDKKE